MSVILVTGAGGQIGGSRRGTRLPWRREERVNGLAARGVDAVVGDFERPGSLPGAEATRAIISAEKEEA
ncbi:MAG: hypothetical protein M3N33_06240 [Actinomycetota bacterium]|nr:hypothetical protein [Actinomycetota bacterium]